LLRFARNDSKGCHCEERGDEAISLRFMRAAAALLFLALAGAMLSACTSAFGGPGPFVRAGNADQVEIGFGGDYVNAMPLARKHCAQFERVPFYVGPTLDGGIFECVRPDKGS
jgi:hypothetical protein